MNECPCMQISKAQLSTPQGHSLVDSVMVKQARQHAHKPLNALGQL